MTMDSSNHYAMDRSTVYDCTVIELDRHHSDRKGNISVVENGRDVPFNIKRTYYLYDVPGGESAEAAHHSGERELHGDLG